MVEKLVGPAATAFSNSHRRTIMKTTQAVRIARLRGWIFGDVSLSSAWSGKTSFPLLWVWRLCCEGDARAWDLGGGESVLEKAAYAPF